MEHDDSVELRFWNKLAKVLEIEQRDSLWLSGQTKRWPASLLGPFSAQSMRDLGCQLSISEKEVWVGRFDAIIKYWQSKQSRIRNNKKVVSLDLSQRARLALKMLADEKGQSQSGVVEELLVRAEKRHLNRLGDQLLSSQDPLAISEIDMQIREAYHQREKGGGS